MPAINIRDFPYDLHRKMRLHAFIQGKTLKSFITKAVREEVRRSEAEEEVKRSLRAESLQRKEEKTSD